MVYGPYDNSFGQGHHTAQFWLMVDNNSGTDVVATIDVVTGYGSNNLGQRQIRRNEFTGVNQWQVFTLEFDNPCFGLVESRVWWSGTVNMKFSQVTITTTSTLAVDLEWLVADQLGTPRMVVNQTGTLTGVKRHDYLPFGEELYATQGVRTTGLGYTSDTIRQKFTSKERDIETGLDYFLARYYSSVQGRFGGADPMNIVFEKQRGRTAEERNNILKSYLAQPQVWNKYSYTLNSPCNNTDPDGRCSKPSGVGKGRVGICIEAFIATARVGRWVNYLAHGDNRSWAPDDPDKSARIMVKGLLNLRGDSSIGHNFQGTAFPSKTTIGDQPGHLDLKITDKKTDDKGGQSFSIHMTGENGFKGLGGPSGDIKIRLDVSISADGKIEIKSSSSATDYPSIAVYVYRDDGNGNIKIDVMVERPEGTVDDLNREMKPLTIKKSTSP
ncbi:MAG: RHS repeat domain-containing protein [Pyrinomonadaceae bacterium]